MLDTTPSLLYRNEKSNKHVCVVNAWQERKLRKELCGRVLQAAQLSAQERWGNANPV